MPREPKRPLMIEERLGMLEAKVAMLEDIATTTFRITFNALSREITRDKLLKATTPEEVEAILKAELMVVDPKTLTPPRS